MCIRTRGSSQPSQELSFDSGNKSSEPARSHLPVVTPEASAENSRKEHYEDSFPSQ